MNKKIVTYMDKSLIINAAIFHVKIRIVHSEFKAVD